MGGIPTQEAAAYIAHRAARAAEAGWQPIANAPDERLVLLYMALPGEPLGFDIGWLEDGDWMLSSKDNEPCRGPAWPTHWMPLPAPPGCPMTFRPDDIIECIEARETEIGPIAVGDRHTVHQVSAAGNFIRLHGSEAFIRASGWKRVGRLEQPGEAA